MSEKSNKGISLPEWVMYGVVIIAALIMIACVALVLLTLLAPTLDWVTIFCGADYKADTGSWEVLTVNANASGVEDADQQNLTNSPDWEDDPVWSPDGTQIVYLAHSGSLGAPDIYVMNADGTDQRNITMSADSEWDAHWSPDGKWILYEFSPALQEFHPAIIRPDGSERTVLDTGHPEDRDPQWSPDGSQIAILRFTSQENGSYVSDIYLLTLPDDLESGEIQETQVTNLVGREDGLVWSPDGTRLTFTNSGDGSSDDLYVINANGSNLVRIESAPDSNAFSPVWSPDGTKILFSSSTSSTIEIHLLDVETQEVTTIGEGASPAWSPDGTRIAFVLDQQIAVMDADGSNVIILTDEPKFYRTKPVWSPDGTHIAFSRLHEVCNMP